MDLFQLQPSGEQDYFLDGLPLKTSKTQGVSQYDHTITVRWKNNTIAKTEIKQEGKDQEREALHNGYSISPRTLRARDKWSSCYP